MQARHAHDAQLRARLTFLTKPDTRRAVCRAPEPAQSGHALRAGMLPDSLRFMNSSCSGVNPAAPSPACKRCPPPTMVRS